MSATDVTAISTSATTHPALHAGIAVAERVLGGGTGRVDYMFQLALEGLLELGKVPGQERYLHEALRLVSEALGITPATHVSWRKQPFSCLTWAAYEATGDKAWLPVFVQESQLMRQEIWRDADGVVLHPRGEKRGGGEAMLIDGIQEYVSRVARTGAVLGEAEWFAEGARQMRVHRQVLRCPRTGLWSQGRGWLGAEPMRLSPGAWSRGHGWLMRGLEHALRSIPHECPEHAELLAYFTEIADALLDVQHADGMWPTLLNRPADQSPPDSSGTAMIAHHMARAVRDGYLTGERYAASAAAALSALPTYVTADGVVLSASPGPGPLEVEEPWMRRDFPPNDPHGTFALLFAAATP